MTRSNHYYVLCPTSLSFHKPRQPSVVARFLMRRREWKGMHGVPVHGGVTRRGLFDYSPLNLLHAGISLAFQGNINFGIIQETQYGRFQRSLP